MSLCSKFSKFFVACAAIFFGIISYTQYSSATSAHSVFVRTKDKFLIEKAVYYRTENLNQSLKYAIKAFEEATKNKNLNSVGVASVNLAETYRLFGDANRSLTYANLAMLIFRILSDVEKMEEATSTLANAYWSKSDFPKAMQYSYLLLRSAEKSKDTLRIIISNTTIANINYAGGNFKEAYKVLDKTLNIAKNFSGLTQKTDFTLNQNIANVLLDLGELDKASEHIEYVCKIADESGNKNMIYTAQTQRGYMYYEKYDFETAIVYFSEALNIAREIGFSNNIASAIMEIGRSYFNWAKMTNSSSQKLELFRKATIELEKASDMFLEIENINEYQYCQELLSESYEQLGDYKRAYTSFKIYKTYQDSLFNLEKSEELTALKLNYAFSKEQDSIQSMNASEILIRDNKIEERGRINLILFVVLLLFLGFGLALYKQYKIIRRKNIELNESNLVKLRFFNMINHDMRSPVANLLQSLYIQKENPSFANLLEKNIIAVENLYQSMDDLLLWSKGQMDKFEPHFRSICLNEAVKSVISLYPSKVSFQFQENEDKVEIKTDEDYFKAIIRNLIANSIHATKGGNEPKIIVSIINNEKQVHVVISDNGKGAEKSEFDGLFTDSLLIRSRGGLGLQMVRDLTRAMRCKVEVDSKPNVGTMVTLIFDK